MVVEQPVDEVLRSDRAAQWALGTVLLIALLLSVGVGALQSQRVLSTLQVEERWRTAGRIASGITHDLGHRLRILQQTVRLVESGDAAFLPRIQDNLRTEVADFGMRLPPERLPRLFDAFHSTKRTGAHIGIGLANVKRLVDAHAGRVRVASRVGEGTHFQIVLKAVSAPASGNL